ncbi:MAG: alanine racemase [Campylobacterota bacterium]|nr:alanine racemase [Campylobacterota bacterium]
MAFIKINKQNFYYNLNQIALKTGSVEKIAIVLKDNAYGHGLELMGKLASQYGIRHAVVRKRVEAEKIDSLFDTILILGDQIINDEKYFYAINTLSDIAEAQKGAKVELKIDTGMHRNGIAMDELDEALRLIKERELDLRGVMTHYRSADVLSSELFWQQKQFDDIKQKLQEKGFANLRVHSHNTAAILRKKHFEEDLVRVGIGAYGYSEVSKPFDTVSLRPVMSLHAKKVSSRVIKPAERIGYGGEFRANKEMHVSTYDLGYGDGWCRGDANHPYMTAEGLPILGRVSMDFIALASEKEEICVMQDALMAAKHFKTISYEVTTALSPTIPKVIIES